MGIVRKEGFDFGFDPGACADCPAHCCRGESGHIWVDQQEILAISSFLRINAIDCIRKYLDRIGNRLSIKERFAGDDFEPRPQAHSPSRFIETAGLASELRKRQDPYGPSPAACGRDLQCLFFDGVSRRCSIYEVRPAQCRRFPFWEYFRKYKDEVIRECPGIRE
jgi:Fe-S-cluster containining protein